MIITNNIRNDVNSLKYINILVTYILKFKKRASFQIDVSLEIARRRTIVLGINGLSKDIFIILMPEELKLRNLIIIH